MGRKLKRAQVVYKGCYVDGQAVEKGTKNVRVVDDDGKVLAIADVPTTRIVTRQLPVLVTLRLPKGTRVNAWSSDPNFKLRADRAEVVRIEGKDGRLYAEAYAKYKNSFVYRVGQVAREANFDTNALQCATGIHFYRGKARAWNWVGA